MSFKVVNNADAGTVTKHGGNDADRVSQLFNGSDVGIPDINSSFRFRSSKLAVRNPANSFSYNFVGSAITADRNLTLPLLTADDMLVTLNLAQTLTNKVISGITNTIIDIPDSALPPGMVYTEMPNTFTETNIFAVPQKFDDYNEVKAITPPANPATGYARLYLDSADNKYKIKKTDGSVIDLEAIGAGAATDDRVMVREAGTIVGSSSRKLNFTVPTDFEFTEDVANDEIEAKIADNAIRDNHVNAHTSTKITITDKTHLNPNATYKDENDWLTDTMVSPHSTTKISTTSKTLLNNQIAYKDETGWLTASMISGSLAKSSLPSSVVYNDQNNNFGAFYQDIAEIAAPAAPALNTGRLFFDSADEHFKIKKSNATVVDLESAGVGGGGGGGGMAAGGTVLRSGDATTTVFTIAHGLSPIPELYWAEAASDDAISNRRTTVTSTDIVVTYAVPPPAGTNNLTFHWAAGYINAASGGFTPSSTTEMTGKTVGDHLDFKRVATPANPSVDVGRMYHRQIDSNNDGMFVKLKKAGSIVEVRIL